MANIRQACETKAVGTEGLKCPYQRRKVVVIVLSIYSQSWCQVCPSAERALRLKLVLNDIEWRGDTH
jgi:hypothetical protein